MCAESMWGNLEDIEKLRTPLGILREQANRLSEATDGILIGNVTTGKSAYPSVKMIATLHIVAPALDNYSYEVLEVKHPILLYPLTIRTYIFDKDYYAECKLEKDYLQTLEHILSSKELRQTIQSLISQCES